MRGREEGAVVVTKRAKREPGLMGLGEAIHVASEGAPAQESVTASLNPETLDTAKLYWAVCPGVTVSEEGEPEVVLSVKSCPMPLSVTVWGLLAALSVSVSVPLRGPLAVGVKVTSIVQLDPEASEPPQLLVWAKSPLMLMVSGTRAPLPVSLRVRVCGELVVETVCPGKLKEVAERVAAGASPVPVNSTVCGLLAA